MGFSPLNRAGRHPYHRPPISPTAERPSP